MVSSNKDRDWDPDEPGFVHRDDAGFEIARVDHKTYLRIPGGEIQVGHVSGRVVAWIDGQQVVLRSPHGLSTLEALREREEVSQSMIRLWHGKYTKALALLREVGAGQVVNDELVESIGIQVTKDLWSRIGGFVDAREIAKES